MARNVNTVVDPAHQPAVSVAGASVYQCVAGTGGDLVFMPAGEVQHLQEFDEPDARLMEPADLLIAARC